MNPTFICFLSVYNFPNCHRSWINAPLRKGSARLAWKATHHFVAQVATRSHLLCTNITCSQGLFFFKYGSRLNVKGTGTHWISSISNQNYNIWWIYNPGELTLYSFGLSLFTCLFLCFIYPTSVFSYWLMIFSRNWSSSQWTFQHFLEKTAYHLQINLVASFVT